MYVQFEIPLYIIDTNGGYLGYDCGTKALAWLGFAGDAPQKAVRFVLVNSGNTATRGNVPNWAQVLIKAYSVGEVIKQSGCAELAPFHTLYLKLSGKSVILSELPTKWKLIQGNENSAIELAKQLQVYIPASPQHLCYAQGNQAAIVDSTGCRAGSALVFHLAQSTTPLTPSAPSRTPSTPLTPAYAPTVRLTPSTPSRTPSTPLTPAYAPPVRLTPSTPSRTPSTPLTPSTFPHLTPGTRTPSGRTPSHTPPRAYDYAVIGAIATTALIVLFAILLAR